MYKQAPSILAYPWIPHSLLWAFLNHFSSELPFLWFPVLLTIFKMGLWKCQLSQQTLSLLLHLLLYFIQLGMEEKSNYFTQRTLKTVTAIDIYLPLDRWAASFSVFLFCWKKRDLAAWGQKTQPRNGWVRKSFWETPKQEQASSHPSDWAPRVTAFISSDKGVNKAGQCHN